MSADPKSLQIIGSRGSGGAERFFARLCDALHARGAPLLAVTPPQSQVPEELAAGTPRITSPMRNVYDPLSRWGLSQLIHRQQPDIVQTWMGRATRLVRLPRGRRPVHVARLGGYYKTGHYRHAHAWIGNTRGICDYLVHEGLPAERVHHIGNFVDTPREVTDAELADLRLAHDIPEDTACILSVGRLHENKDFATLLRAFALLPREPGGRRPLLVLVGDGPLRTGLESLAADLRITDRLVMAGWQTDLSPWYALGDVFVCPSRHEPLGNVILEAWAHRVPVVSTRTQGAEELVTDTVNGILVPVGEPRLLSERLTELLTGNADTRRRLAEQGSVTLQGEHSVETVVARYLDLYRRLLEI